MPAATRRTSPALIAPRPLHLNFGEHDTGSPIEEVREGIERIAAAYAQQQASENFSHFIEPDTGHVLSDTMWEKVRNWFRAAPENKLTAKAGGRRLVVGGWRLEAARTVRHR